MKHIVSFFKNTISVKFMNLVFKIDKNENIYFLYCRRLICKNGDKVQLKQIKGLVATQAAALTGGDEHRDLVELIPNFVLNSTSTVNQRPKDIRFVSKCFTCQNQMSSLSITS